MSKFEKCQNVQKFPKFTTIPIRQSIDINDALPDTADVNIANISILVVEFEFVRLPHQVEGLISGAPSLIRHTGMANFFIS
jgi:hypothetical protein